MPESEMVLGNRRLWRSRRAVQSIAAEAGVLPGEAAILADCEEALRGDVLEVGAGTGRISERLHALARTFVATDYSPPMLERARERYPRIAFELADMRDLSAFGDGTRDAVCIFGSAIDDVELEDRKRVLREVRRVLRQGGAFLFSSHNLATTFPPAWSPYWMHRRGVRSYVRGVANAFRHRGRRVDGDGWAIVNDPHDAFGVLTFHVSRHKQVEMLEESGFGGVRAYGVVSGRLLAPDDDCRDYAIYYAAVRQ